MMLYVLTDGAYSDRHIVAIFSSEAEAEAQMVGLTEGQIEAFLLDEMVQAPLRFAVWMDYETGDHARVTRTCEPGAVSERVYRVADRRTFYVHGIVATSPEHAIKIASEKWRMRRANPEATMREAQ